MKSHLPPALLGVYLNPDEIEQEIRKQGFLDFAAYGVEATDAETLSFFTTSGFLQDAGFSESAKGLTFSNGNLVFGKVKVNSYLASVAGDFLR